MIRGRAGSIMIRGSSTTFDIWEIQRAEWERRRQGDEP